MKILSYSANDSLGRSKQYVPELEAAHSPQSVRQDTHVWCAIASICLYKHTQNDADHVFVCRNNGNVCALPQIAIDEHRIAVAMRRALASSTVGMAVSLRIVARLSACTQRAPTSAAPCFSAACSDSCGRCTAQLALNTACCAFAARAASLAVISDCEYARSERAFSRSVARVSSLSRSALNVSFVGDVRSGALRNRVE